MSDGRAWQGNIKVRLYERVRERGHDSLTTFAEAHPTASLVELADALGPDDIAAVQVFSGLVAEAERSGKVMRLVRGQLVRELAEALPNGWPAVLDDATRFDVAHALAQWTTYTPETHKERVKQARAVLRTSPPSPGWRPRGPDDELLMTLLPDEEA